MLSGVSIQQISYIGEILNINLDINIFRYDEQHLDINDFKPCNFFEHASCVAKMKNEADHSYDHACLPACDHTSIHQESIHVCTFVISDNF